MDRLIIRHAEAEPGDGIDKWGPGISVPDGVRQAVSLGLHLGALGIDLDEEPVAVSRMLRAEQTALCAGLRNIRKDERLDEVMTSDPEGTKRLIDEGRIPLDAVRRARRLIARPPREHILVTHGLLGMGIKQVLGLVQPGEHRVPRNGEVIRANF